MEKKKTILRTMIILGFIVAFIIIMEPWKIQNEEEAAEEPPVEEEVTDWEPEWEWVGHQLKDSTEDEDLDKVIGQLFAGDRVKAQYGKAKVSRVSDGTMIVRNEGYEFRWRKAVFQGEEGEATQLHSDVLNLEDEKLETEDFAHYVLDDGSRYGLEIRRNAKGYSDYVILNWTTPKDYELGDGGNDCGAILYDGDEKWTDDRIVRLIKPYAYRKMSGLKRLAYPYDKYKN